MFNALWRGENKMKIWITGICGFLGSHLAQSCLDAGHEVDGNDSLICGDEKNLPKGLSYTLTDCRNFEVMLANFTQFRPDVVVHCAATAHEGLSSFSPSFITRNIYEASVATFSAAIAAGVKRIVYMSSMSRYGEGFWDVRNQCMSQAPFKEQDDTAPVDPYGIAKVAAEETLKVLCQTHGTKYAIAVPHNLISIKQKYDDPFRNVASIMINRCLQGKQPIIYGDGSQKRCFSPIADVLPSLMKMIEGAADGEVVNIGPDSGEITIEELAGEIMLMTGCASGIVYMPGRPNEVKDAYCSSDKARKLLGYERKQLLHDCLQEMIDDIKKRGVKPFDYFLPLEIVTERTPKTWLEKLI